MCARPATLTAQFVQEETLPLFQREVRERLSPTALELLLSRAEILVEGGAATGRSAQGAFLGSAMLTVDLASLDDRLRGPIDAALATRLSAAIEADAAARHAIIARALEVARARLAHPGALRGGGLRLRTEGTRLLVDLELEGNA